MHNETVKKTFKDFNENLQPLMQKYGIKIVGSWVSMPEHMTVIVYDVPNPDEMIKFMREPHIMGWQAYQTITNRPVSAFEDVMKMLK